MKRKSIKILLATIFFLIELVLPICFYASYFFVNKAYVSYQLNKYDINKDGIWTNDEQIRDYQRWADAYYSGDGARYIFFVYLSCGSLVFGIIYRVIFFLGDKLKNHVYNVIVKNIEEHYQ